MPKLRTIWKAGSEFLPPFTVHEAVNNLLFASSGIITYEEATQLIIKYREENQCIAVDDKEEQTIVDEIKEELNTPLAINLDGSIRPKNDPFDYGLTSNDAEIEYYAWLNNE